MGKHILFYTVELSPKYTFERVLRCFRKKKPVAGKATGKVSGRSTPGQKLRANFIDRLRRNHRPQYHIHVAEIRELPGQKGQ